MTLAPLAANEFGIYIHIPFCASRCDYCAFATWTDRGHLVDDYVQAVIDDIDRSVAAGLPRATSVFFGGGTPSLISGAALASIVERVPVVDGAEVTVECNPDTVTPELLAAYVGAGVNRISLGVQSMVPHVLASLGRTHDPASVEHAVRLVREAGITSFNLDVIYGAAGESIADWRTTLEGVIELAPPHVSAYALTVEAGTSLAQDPARRPDDDDQADKYLLATELLGSIGLEWYEISNWARPGHECRHNLVYWSQGDYQGFGCAAHSHRDGRRFWNVRTPDRYIDHVVRGESVETASEELDGDERRIEGLQLSLRTRAGVPSAAMDPADRELLSPLIEPGQERIVLTAEGRLLANEVAVRLR